MPKKPPRNSFYFFMIDLKEEHRKKGIHYANMTELAEAAGPLWRNAKPSVRAKFEEIAKKEKQKFGGPEHKYTSQGVPYSEIERKQRELKEAMEKERKEIQEMVNSRKLNYSLNTMDIYLMDINSYCRVNNEYIVGEMTVLRFNVQEGYKEYYHELINPVRIPVGYASDVKYGCQEFGLDMPDESKPPTDVISMQAHIVDYLKRSNVKDGADKLPPIFTLPEKVAPVLSFIHQMCRRTGEDEESFRVYQLDLLFYHLRNCINLKGDEGFPKESLAMAQLKRDPFKYTPGLGCQHHEGDERDKSVECTLSRVKRWAFTVLDTCCPVAGVDAKPGCHVPADFDLASIHVVQEQKKIRHAPSVAQEPKSANTSVLSDYTASSSSDFTRAVPKKEKTRVHVPLRKPKTDYSGLIRVAPELSATEFPSLPSRAGRGRGMSSTFSQLSLDE